MTERRRYNFILSVYLTSRGMAWILFEGPYSPVDWSIINARGIRKSERCKKTIETLIDEHRPDAMVLEDTFNERSHRTLRIRTLNEQIRAHATSENLPVTQFTRSDIRRAFAYLGVTNKDIIACEIAKHIPCFKQYVPPVRRPWMSEDARMGLFDATALALLFYQHQLVS